jgi:predicted RNA-binding protein associated with RNAse of E/G family
VKPPSVRIHYRRLPDREEVFEQLLIEETAGCIVTFLPAASLPRAVRIREQVVLDDGAPVVWFTFPGLWYDIGRFHRLDGRFTGFYANLLTPVEIQGERWETTDLILDVWSGADGHAEVLDRDELSQAVAQGWLADGEAAILLERAERLAAAARDGSWPEPYVRDWTLERVREHLSERGYAAPHHDE